ncbi:uncharacterized protein LOC118213344 [Anguilla anguilla]|uniref:uncharacterized protein LOC118213344 n=1 Tax=Anguilla anguilla TaxID=7936 RepID=UPI0015A7F4CA|nr:uncharacterized protein LOC118213344 [Anguilla anguilla]
MASARLPFLSVCVACAVGLLRLARGEESVVHAKVGGVAELGCRLASDATPPPLFPLHVVEWVRRDFDVPVLIKFGPYAPRVHPSFEGRVSLSRGAALLVQQVRLQDEGWFECQILRLNRTMGGSVNGTWVFLSVSAPPEFTKTPPPVIEAMQGDSLTLTCSAHGNPPPTIIWTKDGMPVGKTEETEVVDGTLTAGQVTRRMGGMYKCHVSNTEGSLTHTTQLRVKGPPAILLPPKNTTLNISQNAQLQCRAEAYPPNMTYVWWRHGENVYHIDSLKSRVKILVDGTLLIPNLIPEDSGNYTCMPTNGLLTPPTASAYLTVNHPAQVVQMPAVTYLPAGMGGRIVCPVSAEPPLLSVRWTKDGQVLDLNTFPGWMLMADGSIFIAAANEDAVGTFTCTPYNSYGTMGPSQPTQVVLQDPPSFSVLPQEEYKQEVGTQLVIPCHAHADPSPSVTWAKVGPAPRSPYMVAANGSLVLQPLSKDHHGAWECLAANRVATIRASTRVSVLGTSPHAVSTLSVDPGTNQANVSWVPGFDGGHSQKFTVWRKQTSGQKPEWVSVPVPPPVPHLLVTGLLPGTEYQFSVLPHNRVGTGPFSEIATVKTLDLPPAVTMVPALVPPTSLSANQSLNGIVLRWVRPPPQGPPLSGFILQLRQEGEEKWNVLEGDIGANDSEILLQGLQRDRSYELRMLSLRDGLMSAPSQPLNVSTAGMGAFPARPRLLEGEQQPQLAGALAGAGVLCALLLLLLGAACFLKRSKHRRHQRRKKSGDIPDALQKCPPGKGSSRADSPDSVLKMKACLLNTIFPKFPASRSEPSPSDNGDWSECQEQDRELLSRPRPKSRLWGCGVGQGPDVPSAVALKSISRGPDGRFVVRPYEDGSASSCVEDIPEFPGGGGVLENGRTSRWDCSRSCSLCSEQDDLAVVLSVDLPDASTGSCSDSGSGADPCGSTGLSTPSLPRPGFLPQDGRALVTQMERERESGHLSRCLALAREREALERELELCEARLSARAWRNECWDTGSAQEDSQLRGTDWPPPDAGGGRHLGADTAEPSVSCTLRDSCPIASVSGSVPAPRLQGTAWPQDLRWEDPGAGPTNLESACLLSDGMEAGHSHRRAPSKGSAGRFVSMPTTEARSDKGKTDSFSQNSTHPSQRHFLQGGEEEGGRVDRGYSPGSTWPYSRGGGGGAHKTGGAESLGMTPSGSSTPSFPETDKEVIRAQLWSADQCLRNSSCGKTPSTSPTGSGDGSSRPDSSVSRTSGSARPDPKPHPYQASQPHSSPVLRYLSLPGFVEMNVDEPVDASVPAGGAAGQSRGTRAGEPLATGPGPRPGGATLRESRHHPAEPGAAGWGGRAGSSGGTLRRPLRRSRSLTREAPAGRGGRGGQTGHSDLHRGRASWGLSFGQDTDPALTQTTGGPRAQASRTHPLPSVCDAAPQGCGQAASRGPSRTQRDVPPNLPVRKWASLKSRPHPVSHVFPSPEMWVRSLSLGSTSMSRLDPLRGAPHSSEEPPSRSSPLTPSPPATGHQRLPVSPDPRRQATVLPEVPRFPVCYQEAPPPLPGSATPRYPSNPPNSARDRPAPLQPGHAPLTRQGPKQEREAQPGAEEATEGSEEEEGRGSYASQSSGRGSLGPLSGHTPCPSPCPSPTQPSSPPTLQEGKAGGRRVSVDENYEWDTADVHLESDPCKASRPHPNQEGGAWDCPRAPDLHSKGDRVSLSSCVVKYQLSPGSPCSRTRDLDSVLF